MRLIRIACCAYWCLLTLLLLHPDPRSLLGIERLPGTSGGRGIHFACFVVLAFLTASSRFGVRRVVLAAGMLSYAVAAEAAQGFVPSRIVDPIDAAENVAGLLVGTAIWWIVWKRLRSATLGGMAPHDHPDQESDDRENAQAGGR